MWEFITKNPVELASVYFLLVAAYVFKDQLRDCLEKIQQIAKMK